MKQIVRVRHSFVQPTVVQLPNLDKMSKQELIKYASEKGITINTKTTKNNILKDILKVVSGE